MHWYVKDIKIFILGKPSFRKPVYLKERINNEGTMPNKANHSVSCVYFFIAVNKCLCKFHLHNCENRLKSVLLTI